MVQSETSSSLLQTLAVRLVAIVLLCPVSITNGQSNLLSSFFSAKGQPMNPASGQPIGGLQGPMASQSAFQGIPAGYSMAAQAAFPSAPQKFIQDPIAPPVNPCALSGKCGSCVPSAADPSLCNTECFVGTRKRNFLLNPTCKSDTLVPLDMQVHVGNVTVKNIAGKTRGISVWKGTNGAEGTFVLKVHNWQDYRLPKTESALVNIQALNKLSVECGVSQYYVRSAFRVFRRGKKRMMTQTMDMAKGTSVASLINAASAPSNEVLQRSIRNAGPRLAELAISELLFAGGDTNIGNVFMTPEGMVNIIDHDSYMEERAMCNSVFLPGTSHMIKKPALRALDYRCYTPGGVIGKNYPPGLKQCIEKIAGMHVTEVEKTYVLPNMLANKLLWRAQSLNRDGFEATMTAAGCGTYINERPTKHRTPKNLLGKWQACCTSPTAAAVDKKIKKKFVTTTCPEYPADMG